LLQLRRHGKGIDFPAPQSVLKQSLVLAFSSDRDAVLAAGLTSETVA
jgi:hypothetical protein